jgi:glycosyltransferase involved in cell wall biosynthesis
MRGNRLEWAPVVSIGMPVKNGAKTIEGTLRNLLSQSLGNYRIIISDNCSEDSTGDICKRLAKEYLRVEYFRQPSPLTALENFNFVLQQATGEYFLWAAHDDLHSTNFLPSLVSRLEIEPDAVLAFGGIVLCYPNSIKQAMAFDFSTGEMGPYCRVWKTAQLQCYHIYGLWRREALLKVQFRQCLFWPDLVVMLGMACLGTFVSDDRAIFYRYERVKPYSEVVRYFFGGSAVKVGRVRMFAELLIVTYRTLCAVRGSTIALWGAVATAVRFLGQLANISERMRRKRMASQGYG